MNASARDTLTHRGYMARVEFSAEDDALVGRLVTDPAGDPVRDVVSFHGETVAALRAALVEAVDDYIDLRETRGDVVAAPASGRLALRLPPDLHRAVRAAAARTGKSVNAFIVERLQRDVAPDA